MARNGDLSEEEVCSEEEYSETESEHPVKPESEEEDEEEVGSEAESESELESKAKPLATKPVEQREKASNGSAAKRPAEEEDAAAARVAKKPKTTDEAGAAVEVKPNLFQRVWSEGDEIGILQGMIDFASKKKGDPVSVLTAFLDFVKPNIHFDVTKSQLQDKIRRLKKKYENNKSREKDGKQIISSNPHELKSYDLSKLIWGKENGKRGEEGKDVQGLKSNSFFGANPEEMILIAAQSLGLEGTEGWEKLKEEELKLYLKQLKVRVAQTKLVLDDIKGRK